jgi:hypothetical protein
MSFGTNIQFNMNGNKQFLERYQKRRVLVLLFGCLGVYLLISEKVPKTMGFGIN